MRWLVLVVAIGCSSETKPVEPTTPPAQKPAPFFDAAVQASGPVAELKRAVQATSDEVDAIVRERTRIGGAATKVNDQSAAATTDGDRAAAKAVIGALVADRDKLAARIDQAHDQTQRVIYASYPDRTDELLDLLKRAEEHREVLARERAESTELGKRLATMGEELATRQSDADRASAREKLEQLQREKAEYERKLKKSRR